MEALGVPYFFESECIMQRAKELDNCTSICSYCSRMKRGMLYSCARREGYNVLSLGQHLDDLSESFLMSILHNGLMRTMKVNYFISLVFFLFLLINFYFLFFYFFYYFNSIFFFFK